MASIGKSGSVAAQLANGASIMAAYKTLDAQDARGIKSRIEAFSKQQAAYQEAHQKVASVVSERKAAQDALSAAGEVVDGAIDALCRLLVAEGHDMRRPFVTYGVSSATRLQRMRLPEKLVAIGDLVAKLRSDKALSPAAMQAVGVLTKSVAGVETCNAHVIRLDTAMDEARAECAGAGERWAAAFDALKAGCESAAYDGAPRAVGIFNSAQRARTKRAKGNSNPTDTSTAADDGNGATD